MRSRTARLSTGAIAWIAIAASAFFLIRSDKKIAESRAAVRAIDLHAREADDALADLRVAQEAYVANGQGVAFWMPKVVATGDLVRQAIASLKEAAGSAQAKSSLDEAMATMTDFDGIDKRARDYLNAGQHLMASDVIFTEGGDRAAAAAKQVETARLAEHEAHDASEAALRGQQALALAATAGVLVVAVLALALGDGRSPAAPGVDRAASSPGAVREPNQPVAEAGHRPVAPHRAAALALNKAAELCTDFGRVRDHNDLERLLARAAEMIDAHGLVVWLGNAAGSDLQPMLAHGYPPQAVARMPKVPRSGDNAAAAAYRTGQLQIVLERPGTSNGAVVAPILTIDGCIGALSAEIRGGGEASEYVQALSAIFAAQLATVLAAVPAAVPAATDQRAAANS